MLYDTTQLALNRAIQGTEQRNTALAANMANANTPGYQRVDVDFHTALAAAVNSDDSAAAVRSASFSTQADPTAQTRIDGSSFDSEAEGAKLAANGLEHQAAVTVAAARISIMKSALGVN